MAVPPARPAFLITIDTEGDYLWGGPREITTHNARWLPRFQALCERHGLRPTWLTNYEMAVDPLFREFARDLLARNVGEVGMHLHAWNSPPLTCNLTGDDWRHRPYLIDYPETVMADKIHYLTDLLEEVFGLPMVSHRAGRWAFDATYARLLAGRGYRVDCSVTPHVSWRETPGDPAGQGGSDYRAFPQGCYFMDLDAIHQPGSSPLLEVPVSIRKTPYAPLHRWLPQRCPLCMRIAWRLFPELRWLRPIGRGNGAMLAVLRGILARGEPYAEFMLHSSELMPGGSPTFPDQAAIERLYADLERLFAFAARHFVGQTLAEFHASRIRGGHGP
ncbi:MAG: deacetylase [Magnetococcales bacterium]|nr:deacetylase [Magnetococcales bacterium]